MGRAFEICYKFGSSEKSVGELRLGKFAKCVIKRKFQDPKGAETVRFSHRGFGFVVEALDDAARVDFSRPEIVQEQLAVLRRVRANFFIGSMRERITWRHHSSRNLPAQNGEV